MRWRAYIAERRSEHAGMKLAHADRRALGRLRPDRLRATAASSSAMAASASSAPSRRRCGRPPRPTGRPTAIHPRLGRGRRRALAVSRPGPARGLAAEMGRCRASPRRPRRSAISASSPTWRRYGAGCASGSTGSTTPEALNLFGYTGVGTLALAAKGAKMVACRCLEEIGRGARAPMRSCRAWPTSRSAGWSTTPTKFAAREVRRGRRYDGILLDPPKFGRGPEGEVWRLEEGSAGADRRLPPAARRRSRASCS